MGAVDALLDAHYSLAAMKMNASPVSVGEVVRVLQDEWGCPDVSAIAKASGDDDGPSSGQHGIPEIGRQERAFYDGLTAGQKEAYRGVKLLVEQLFDEKTGFDNIDPWAINEPIDEWKAKALAELATHPTKAYMLGQMLASAHLNEPLHRPMLPTDGRAITFLQHHTFNEIDSSFEALKAQLRSSLIAGISAGENPREVARKLANDLKDYETQWDVVAITETSRAESQGRLRELQDAGEEYCIGSSAHDLRTCDDCKRLIDGKVYRVADVIKNNNYGRKRADWLPCIPAHPRCVVAGSRVLTRRGLVAIENITVGDYVLTHRSRFRRVDAVMSRLHSGTILNVGGLRVTGNHPILTPDGFRLASSLGDCADVLGVDPISWAQIARDANDAPSQCTKNGFFHLVLRALFRRGVPSAAVNFYRQVHVGDRQVDIEAVNRELWNNRRFDYLQHLVQFALQVAHAASDLIGERAFAQLFDGNRRAPNRFMRRANLHLALVGGHVAPFQNLGFRGAANGQSERREPANESQSRTPRFFEELVNGFSSNMLGVPLSNPLLSRAATSPLVRTERISDSLFTGDVHDLQVREDESYVVEGIAVHNCRCVWLPHSGPA